MRRKFTFLAIALTAAWSASAGELSIKDASAARKVYVAKCAKCHKFYEPKNYSDRDWELWMTKMSRKSNLKAEQDALLRQYLGEYRAGKRQKVR